MDSQTHQSKVADPHQEEQLHLTDVLGRIRTMLERLFAVTKNPLGDDRDRDEAQTAEEVAEEVVERLRQEQIATLTVAEREPYFGRLDFQEHGHPTVEPLYIGKRGVERTDTGDRMVVDWRAPAASLFYSFTGQDTASYDAPDGPIEGKVLLKRNIAVKNGELQRVVDSYVEGQDNLNVTDEFLLYRLGENKDSRLRDIVSTIQAEQDKIIRAERDKAIVIQGVAGSGKTTVALHRLAYLLYQHADRLRAERMVIFAPNAMFVEYISEVLPELGVGGIQQTTFAQWALQKLDYSVKLRDPAARLARWFGIERNAALEKEFRISRAKGSIEFLQKIDQRIQALTRSYLPSEDFQAWDGAILSAKTIETWYTQDYVHYPTAQRRERVLARVKRWYEMEYKAVKGFDKTGSIKKTAASRFRAYANRWMELQAADIYQDILAEVLPEADVLTKQTISTGRGKKKERPEVDAEDLAPLLYIQTALHGLGGQDQFDHVVIDEAQDFSPFQIALLQVYCPSLSFTILGDLSQSIHTYQGITSWDDFLTLFPEERGSYFQLDVSYRSTMEIIDFANHVIQHFEGFTLAKPVFRSGDEVIVTQSNGAERIPHLASAIEALRKQVSTVAVVTRTEEEAGRLYEDLRNAGVETSLIEAKDQHYQGGTSVLPVYLTKGLEFDAVLLVDVNAATYDHSPLSAKLLYVGCTRALHKLWIHSSDAPSPLLPGDEHKWTQSA